MKCNRCNKEITEGKKVQHPNNKNINLIFCFECAELTGNKNAEIVN
jgi:hypothetical protein